MQSVAVVRAFGREFARVGGLLSPDFLESGMTLGEARCVYELGAGGEMTPSALAEMLSLDLGYVSRVLSRLVASGLATKQRGEDGRTRRVALTAAGKKRLAVLGKRTDTRLANWLGTRPPTQVDELAQGMGAFLGERAPLEMRDARPGDAGHVIQRHAEIYVEELSYPALFEAYVAEAFAAFLKDFAPPGDRFVVAERAGRFVGSVAGKAVSATTMQLRFLIVERSERGAGLGRRLVQDILDHARAQGMRRVVLDTASDLHVARAIYKSCGFRRTKVSPPVDWLPRGTRSERWELVF